MTRRRESPGLDFKSAGPWTHHAGRHRRLATCQDVRAVVLCALVTNDYALEELRSTAFFNMIAVIESVRRRIPAGLKGERR